MATSSTAERSLLQDLGLPRLRGEAAVTAVERTADTDLRSQSGVEKEVLAPSALAPPIGGHITMDLPSLRRDDATTVEAELRQAIASERSERVAEVALMRRSIERISEELSHLAEGSSRSQAALETAVGSRMRSMGEKLQGELAVSLAALREEYSQTGRSLEAPHGSRSAELERQLIDTPSRLRALESQCMTLKADTEAGCATLGNKIASFENLLMKEMEQTTRELDAHVRDAKRSLSAQIADERLAREESRRAISQQLADLERSMRANPQTEQAGEVELLALQDRLEERLRCVEEQCASSQEKHRQLRTAQDTGYADLLQELHTFDANLRKEILHSSGEQKAAVQKACADIVSSVDARLKDLDESVHARTQEDMATLHTRLAGLAELDAQLTGRMEALQGTVRQQLFDLSDDHQASLTSVMSQIADLRSVAEEHRGAHSSALIDLQAANEALRTDFSMALELNKQSCIAISQEEARAGATAPDPTAIHEQLMQLKAQILESTHGIVENAAQALRGECSTQCEAVHEQCMLQLEEQRSQVGQCCLQAELASVKIALADRLDTVEQQMQEQGASGAGQQALFAHLDNELFAQKASLGQQHEALRSSQNVVHTALQERLERMDTKLGMLKAEIQQVAEEQKSGLLELREHVAEKMMQHHGSQSSMLEKFDRLREDCMAATAAATATSEAVANRRPDATPFKDELADLSASVALQLRSLKEAEAGERRLAMERVEALQEQAVAIKRELHSELSRTREHQTAGLDDINERLRQLEDEARRESAKIDAKLHEQRSAAGRDQEALHVALAEHRTAVLEQLDQTSASFRSQVASISAALQMPQPVVKEQGPDPRATLAWQSAASAQIEELRSEVKLELARMVSESQAQRKALADSLAKQQSQGLATSEEAWRAEAASISTRLQVELEKMRSMSAVQKAEASEKLQQLAGDLQATSRGYSDALRSQVQILVEELRREFGAEQAKLHAASHELREHMTQEIRETGQRWQDALERHQKVCEERHEAGYHVQQTFTQRLGLCEEKQEELLKVSKEWQEAMAQLRRACEDKQQALQLSLTEGVEKLRAQLADDGDALSSRVRQCEKEVREACSTQSSTSQATSKALQDARATDSREVDGLRGLLQDLQSKVELCWSHGQASQEESRAAWTSVEEKQMQQRVDLQRDIAVISKEQRAGRSHVQQQIEAIVDEHSRMHAATQDRLGSVESMIQEYVKAVTEEVRVEIRDGKTLTSQVSERVEDLASRGLEEVKRQMLATIGEKDSALGIKVREAISEAGGQQSQLMAKWREQEDSLRAELHRLAEAHATLESAVASTKESHSSVKLAQTSLEKRLERLDNDIRQDVRSLIEEHGERLSSLSQQLAEQRTAAVKLEESGNAQRGQLERIIRMEGELQKQGSQLRNLKEEWQLEQEGVRNLVTDQRSTQEASCSALKRQLTALESQLHRELQSSNDGMSQVESRIMEELRRGLSLAAKEKESAAVQQILQERLEKQEAALESCRTDIATFKFKEPQPYEASSQQQANIMDVGLKPAEQHIEATMARLQKDVLAGIQEEKDVLNRLFDEHKSSVDTDLRKMIATNEGNHSFVIERLKFMEDELRSELVRNDKMIQSNHAALRQEFIEQRAVSTSSSAATATEQKLLAAKTEHASDVSQLLQEVQQLQERWQSSQNTTQAEVTELRQAQGRDCNSMLERLRALDAELRTEIDSVTGNYHRSVLSSIEQVDRTLKGEVAKLQKEHREEYANLQGVLSEQRTGVNSLSSYTHDKLIEVRKAYADLEQRVFEIQHGDLATDQSSPPDYRSIVAALQNELDGLSRRLDMVLLGKDPSVVTRALFEEETSRIWEAVTTHTHDLTATQITEPCSTGSPPWQQPQQQQQQASAYNVTPLDQSQSSIRSGMAPPGSSPPQLQHQQPHLVVAAPPSPVSAAMPPSRYMSSLPGSCTPPVRRSGAATPPAVPAPCVVAPPMAWSSRPLATSGWTR